MDEYIIKIFVMKQIKCKVRGERKRRVYVDDERERMKKSWEGKGYCSDREDSLFNLHLLEIEKFSLI